MFCNYCGKSNPDDSKFCSGCGKIIVGDSEPVICEEQMHTVDIFRDSQAYLINPPINILIDNETRCSIANGASLQLKLQGGEHSITFSQSARKKTIKFDLTKDTSIRVKWNRITGAIETSIK